MRIPIALCLAAFAGCSNSHQIQFADTPLNQSLPDDFKNRVLWTQTDQFKYHLDQLVGHIIYNESGSTNFERGPRYIDPQKMPALKTIAEGTVYHSKVNQAAAFQGGYLAFAANIHATNAVDVSITDTAEIFIPYDDIPMQALLDEAKKPKPTPSTKRYYVQGALLATVIMQSGRQFDASASAGVAEAYKAEGHLYDQTSQTAKDVRISIVPLDIDRLSVLAAGRNLEGESLATILRASRVYGIQVGFIGGLTKDPPDRP
jgi:hypothetical protein